jgi:hypothetical protein
MKIFLIPLMIGAVTGMMAVGMLANMVFAQGTDTAATTSGVYVTVVLAVISLVNSLFSTYLAQKAKMTGQAPNETDLRIQQQLVLLQEKVGNASGAIANLVDFVGNKVAPEQFNQIKEGTLPYIKAQEVIKKAGEIQADVKHGEDLLNEIQDKVQK